MKKNFFGSFSLVFAVMLVLVLAGFNWAKANDEIVTIKLDGDMTEWRDVPLLLTNTEIEYPPFLGTTYYWNHDNSAWQTEALDNACFYNETTSLDMGLTKFANDADNLYFAWAKRGDYYDIYWWTNVNGTDYLDIGAIMDGPIRNDNSVNKGNPPCLNDLLNLPINYNHDMVFAFDTNLDLKSDYYLVINFNSLILSPGIYPISTVTSYIYKDDGNGIYNKDEEDLISNLGTDFEIIASVTPVESFDVHQEGRIKIDKFFTDLGIEWGKNVLVRYEAHSGKAIFTSQKNVYSFNKKNKLGLKIISPKSKKQRNVKKEIETINIKASVKKKSKITILVNKKKKASFTVKGKFSKKVSLKKGGNVVIIKAKKGKQAVKKGIYIKRNKK